MARKNGFNDELDELNVNGMQDSYDQDAAYDDEYDADAYDDEYDAEDEYGDEYDGDEEYDEDDGDARASGRGGFLSTVWGKVAIGIIVLLVAAIIVLLVWQFVSGRNDAQDIPNEPMPLPAAEETTQAPGSVVFAPITEATDEPTQAPTAAPEATATPSPIPTPVPTDTPAPTDTPEPTATPLPIILSNTPTPSPSPTASPTPTPSPSPTPSPKPTATPSIELAQGETNREAKLRESASASAKVKKTLKKGEDLTIHEIVLDKDGKIWYAVTANDLDTQGWMRDYVVDVEGELEAPTPTPKATATPKAGEAALEATAEPTPMPEVEAEAAGIGTGKTNRDANVRKIMNGKVVTQLRTGKAVIILDAKLDKNGDLWYEIQVKNSTTKGFVRDYVIKLDKGVEIERPTPTPKLTETPTAEAETSDTAESVAQAAGETSLLDREVVGKAKTNRAANVREKPAAGAGIVRQLSKGNELMILEKYAEGKSIWYEVATESGKTHGFVRDYVISITEINENLEAKAYEEVK